jgi:hypothetical protein
MRKIILSLIPVMFAIAFLTACGNTSVNSSGSSNYPNPPKLTVKIANQSFPTVTRGYSWSNGGYGTVADAPSPIASNLKKYNAKVGDKAILSFEKKPKSIEMTIMSNGKQISKTNLSKSYFNLPTKAGDYTYIITGHWSGNNRVNYNYAVQVK